MTKEKELLDLILNTRPGDKKRYKSLSETYKGNGIEKFFYVLSCFSIPDIFDSLSQENILKLSLFFDTQDREELKKRLDYFINLKGEKYWSKIVFKLPANYLNTTLTDKPATLNKLDSDIRALQNLLKKTSDPKRKYIIRKQIKRGREAETKCKANSLENYKLTVYEKYAVFGGFKILSDNNFKPTPFYFTDLLRELNFKNINKREIWEIKKAMHGLTEKKFPCYMIFKDKTDPKKYTIVDEDEPIFKIRLFGTLDLNLQIELKDISSNKLYLQLNNLTLITDLTDSDLLFYALVHSNLIANLRDFKKVQAWDLCFIEFLIRARKFHRHGGTKKIELNQLCKKIKKDNFLDANKNFIDRHKKIQFKNVINQLSGFAVNEKLIKGYNMDDNSAIFEFKKQTNTAKRELGA